MNEPRCMHMVGGRDCRNPVTWQKLWPGNPHPWFYCTRHKNWDIRALKGYDFSSIWVPHLQEFKL